MKWAAKWSVFAKGGQQDTGMDAIEWAIRAEQLGAGELVVNSIGEDGVKDGYNLELTRAIAEALRFRSLQAAEQVRPNIFTPY